jgi:hypothetical protein
MFVSAANQEFTDFLPKTPKNFMLDKIIRDVKDAFKNEHPNGMLLGWDDERFYQELSDLTKKGELVDQTDFNYSFCNTFSYYYYPFDKDKNYEMATLKISFVSNVFDIRWWKYRNRGRSPRIIESPENYVSKEWEQQVKAFFEKKGFVKCLPEWHSLHIEGIDLELSEKGKVTLGKCLFDDYED